MSGFAGSLGILSRRFYGVRGSVLSRYLDGWNLRDCAQRWNGSSLIGRSLWGVQKWMFDQDRRKDPVFEMSSSGVAVELVPNGVVGWLSELGNKLREKILDSIVLNTPKRRVTRSRKRKRALGSYLKPTQGVRQCELCQEYKMPHKYCSPKDPCRRKWIRENVIQ
mmetsp:Transcript_11077/g.20031  ORF Transcript_11077/g.20031 Transcript_11077/m.20031 type:complete len:165 (-) Transcript_11077:34-528(-)